MLKVHFCIFDFVYAPLYEKINVHLHYFFCTIIKGDIVLKEHEEAAWVSKEEFNKYKFAEGDKDIISLL